MAATCAEERRPPFPSTRFQSIGEHVEACFSSKPMLDLGYRGCRLHQAVRLSNLKLNFQQRLALTK